MHHIKFREDFHQIEDERIKSWLKKENQFIPSKHEESDFIPDEHGWLIVLEETDSINNLNTGVGVIDDILNINYWEFIMFNPALDLWLAVVIIDNGFGMSIAVPDIIIKDSPLRKTFSDQLAP